MRYMMLVKANKDFEAGSPPNPELIAAVAKLADEASAQGVMVASGGLLPSSQGVRIRVAGGKTQSNACVPSASATAEQKLSLPRRQPAP